VPPPNSEPHRARQALGNRHRAPVHANLERDANDLIYGNGKIDLEPVVAPKVDHSVANGEHSVQERPASGAINEHHVAAL
jgi:hypothetical protein